MCVCYYVGSVKGRDDAAKLKNLFRIIATTSVLKYDKDNVIVVPHTDIFGVLRRAKEEYQKVAA